MRCGSSKAHHHPGVLVSHRDSCTTLHGRILIVQRQQQGWKQTHIAAAIGISPENMSTRGLGAMPLEARPDAGPVLTTAPLPDDGVGAR